MQDRLRRLQDATEQPNADVDSLLLSVLLPPVVEIPEAVANSTRRFVAFVRRPRRQERAMASLPGSRRDTCHHR